MSKPLRQPALNEKIVNLLVDYVKNDPDFEYWWNIAKTKIQYFIRMYENIEDGVGKKKQIAYIMFYLIEKWERHLRFLNENPNLLKEIKRVFKEQRKQK